MLRGFRRFLLYFRWPLAAGLATLLLLVCLLQPRPMAEHHFPSKDATIKISPSGKFLVLYDAEVVQIYQIKTMELQNSYEGNECVALEFDSDDNLVFANYATGPTPEDARLQLWHWQRGQPKPKMVATRRTFSPGPDDGFRGLYESEDASDTHCCLLPNARKWLIPVTDGAAIRFELVDARIGDSVRLDMPVVEIENPSIYNFTVVCSPGSNELVTYSSTLSKIDEKNGTTRMIRWFDVRTGKLLHTKVLELLNQFDHYGQLRILQREKVVAISQKDSQLTLQLHTDAAGHQSIAMNETLANLAEHPWSKAKDSSDWNPFPDTDCKSMLDGSKNLLIYWWEHQLYPRSGNSTWPRSIPGFYYGVRELCTGKLLHTERLPDRLRQPDDWKKEGWEMLDVLPGTVLMLQQPDQPPPPWHVKWEEWRLKYIPWCPSLPIGPLRLLFIEATTGKRLSELSLPYTRIEHCFNKQQHALYVIGHINDEMILQAYDYPLHKPWLLIWSWA